MQVNTTMTEWEIPSTTPPLYLGEQGENNAMTVSIEIQEDEVIDKEVFPDVKYYLDIYDDVDGETPIPTTQELSLVKTTNTFEILDEEGNPVLDDNDEPITEETNRYFLKMSPSGQWLGKANVKILQIRCSYTDTTDTENPIERVLKSNTFRGLVRKSVYPYLID